jgi:uncharacterized protein
MNIPKKIQDLSYLSSGGVFVVIHRPTGKWCSMDVDDICELRITNEHGSLGNILGEDSTPNIETVWEALEIEGNYSGSDNRSFEYLLLKCTSECNYCCTYCYDHDEAEKSKNLDIEKTFKSVKEAIDLSNDCLTLLFHGGEPLLRLKFIQEVSAFAKQYADESGKRIILKMQTNGGLFTDEAVAFLTEYDFFVGISLDGPPQINDKFRIMKNGEGTYGKFHAAYMKYGKFMRDKCGIITTPTSVSADHLLLVARHFRDMGFKGWRTTNYLALGRVQNDWKYETDMNTYVDSVLGLVDAIEGGEFNGFFIGPVMSLLTNLVSHERPDMCTPGNNACGAGRRFLAIEADGAILPCDILSREQFKIGNISVNSLSQALDHPKLKIIAESLPRNICQQCYLLGICGGTCLGLSSLNDNRPMLCNSYKLLYPELMRRLHKSSKLLDYFDGCI